MRKYDNLRAKFKKEYGTGRITITDWANNHGLQPNTVKKWKVKYFGTQSLRKRDIYMLYCKGVDKTTIMRLYNVHRSEVNRVIKEGLEGNLKPYNSKCGQN